MGGEQTANRTGIAPVVLNLVLLVVTGLSICWWILYYTELFPVVGGLLGLGGLFTWVAFLVGILSSRRKEQLQELFDHYFLGRWRSGVLLSLVLLGWWLAFTPFRGTVLVDTLGANRSQLLEIRPVHPGMNMEEPPLLRRRLPAVTRTKVPLPVPWFGNAEYHIKVSGLPGRRLNVRALHREPLIVPDMLTERPVLLIRPSAEKCGPVSWGFSLRVQIGQDKPILIKDYRGEAVLVGADEDIILPDRLVADWQLEFRRAGLNPEGAERWMHPEAVAEMKEISAGSAVKVELVRRVDNVPKYRSTVTVPSGGKAGGFLMEVVIHEEVNS